MKDVIFWLRLAMGWFFAYAGLSKIINPEWTAAGFLNNADTFSGLYAWFGSPDNIGWVNFVNEWGLLLIGLALIFGFRVKWASIAGIALMALYYFPTLNFPRAGEHAYIIDDHVIYALALWLFVKADAGKYKGMDGKRE